MRSSTSVIISMKSSFLLMIRSIALLAALLLGARTQAGLQIPYTPDASTLHLWHLNETSGLTAADATTASPITLTIIGLPNPGTGPYTNTAFGAPSAAYPNLGTSVSGNHKSHVLDGGVFPDVSQFSDTGTGAFTFEAILKFDTNPLGAIDAEIVAGDNNGGITTRGWQWRIFNGVME